QVLELTLSQAQRVLPYDHASLWQRNGSGDRWHPVASRGQNGAGNLPAADPAGPDENPIGEVLTTRASLLIPDASSDTRFAGRANRPGSWLGVPLIHQGNLLAVLALEKTEVNAFTSAQVPLAQAFAQQAAVALANVRRYEDSVQRAFELDERSSLLNRVASTLSQTMEPAEVLSATLSALAEALGISRGAALLFDESRSTSRVRATTRYPAGTDDSASTLPLTGNVLVDHLRDGLAPVMAADVSADPLVRPEYAEWIGPDTRSALFLPLAVAGELLGLVGIGHSGRRPFAAGEIEFAMTLANQAALAAHNARQYQQTQRRLTELATIGQASRALSQTIDLKQVYETVRTHIEVSLHADSYYLALYDEARGEVTYPLAVERGQSLELSRRAPDALIRQILDTGQPLLLSGDTNTLLPGASETGAEPEPLAPGRAKSYLGVPLLLGTRVTGVLAVADYQRAYAFTDKHERSLATIAAPIAAAVDGARLFAESAQRARALDARGALLGRISVQLSESGSLTDILLVAAQAVAETLMVEVGGAFVLDETPGAVLPLASARYPEAGAGALPAFIPAGSSLLQQLQASLAPIALSELAGQTTALPEITGWLGESITAALFLPLITADRLIGVVAAAQTTRGREFTPGEIDLAMSLTNQAAVAVANAYLQEKMQPRLIELAAISRICQAIARPAGLAQLWETIRMEVGAALEAPSLVLALYDAAAQAVSFPVILDAGQSLTATPRAPAGAIAYILQNRAPLLLNGDVEAQLTELGGEYRALVAGARVPVSYLGVPLVL
ncbi:MAG: GAF domain-containing protein, partial [Anaerolineales bacterium]